MGWLDPLECKQARDYLQQNQVVDAARVLLGAKHREHRAVTRLLAEVGRRLVEQARRQAEEGLWEAAKETIGLAAQCVALDGPALVLRQQIEEAIAEKRRLQELKEQERLNAAQKAAEAKRLVEAGEFQTALELLQFLASVDAAQAEALTREIRLTADRFDRAVSQCRAAIAAGDRHLARHFWQQAKQLCPHAPLVAQLAGEMARLVVAGDRPTERPVLVNDRSQRFVIEHFGVVILADHVAIGSPQAEGVELPLLGRLHRRHAVLVRDRLGWQIMACRDKHGQACFVKVDEVRVESTAPLRDGSVIQLAENGCAWQFRLPVAGSLTAIWEALPGSGSTVFGVQGESAKRAIFLADELVIGSVGPAHLVLKDFPCSRLILSWTDGGLNWRVEGGECRAEAPGLALMPDDQQVYVPSRLALEPQCSEAERLGRMVFDHDFGGQEVLTFLPWKP